MTVNVSNEAGLKAALENNQISYIILEDNITLTAGITIDASRDFLVIDGEFPTDSGVHHSLTEYDGFSDLTTISIRSTSTMTITLKNMIINGKNYYGIPYIVPSDLFIDTSGVTVIYDNIVYEGPQLSYHRFGTTRILDSDITIIKTGISPVQELAEPCKLEIGGKTTVYHTDEGDGVVYYRNSRNDSYFKILSDSDVSIESENNYFYYNYLVFVLTPFDFIIEPRGSLVLKTKYGISNGSGHVLRSFVLGEGAKFHFIQTGIKQNVSSLYIGGSFEVQSNSDFLMQTEINASPLLTFTSGIGHSLSINNPQSFVLYCVDSAAMSSSGTTSVNLSGGQFNTWISATVPFSSAGGFNDPFDFKWFKKDYADPVIFTGNFQSNATTVTSNMDEEDEPHPLDSDLRLDMAKVISVGDWTLSVDPIIETGRDITGATSVKSNIKIEYEIDDNPHVLEDETDESGIFAVSTQGETPPTIPIDTDVKISSNIPFLIKSIIEKVQEQKEIYFLSVPETISFNSKPIMFSPPILPRKDFNTPVVIKDDRVYSSPWKLWLSLRSPLTAETGEVLNDAVIYVDEPGDTPIVLTNDEILVYESEGFVERVDVEWAENAGILVRILETIRSDVPYTTHVDWYLYAEEP